MKTTKINIGNSKKNIVGYEIEKPFEEITVKDIWNIIEDIHGTKEGISIMGWVDTTDETYKRPPLEYREVSDTAKILAKGEYFYFLNYRIQNSLNNDGIVLFNLENQHSGNFGDSVDLAKRYALIYYMLSKPKLHSCLVSRLANERGGHYHDYYLLRDEIRKDGFKMPEGLKCSDGINMSLDLINSFK